MSFRPHAIEVDGGILWGTTVYDQNGSHQSSEGIGSYRFTVDVIEEDGGRVEFGVREPVRDVVAGGPA